VSDFDACQSPCRRNGAHTLRRWECALAPKPPCEHPAEAICWASDSSGIICKECFEEISVRKLAEEATVSASMGCWCTEECSCKARPFGWSLDPRKVLRVLDLMGE
jgi:hypothetical protein